MSQKFFPTSSSISDVNKRLLGHFYQIELNFIFLSTSLLRFLWRVLHRVKSRLSMESTSTPLPGSPTHNHRSPASTPTRSNLGDWSFCNLPPSSTHSNGSCHTLTPSASPTHSEHHTDIKNEKSMHSRHSSSTKGSQRRGHSCIRTEEALSRPNFEPKNLLSLFEETTPWEQGCQFTFKGKFFHFKMSGEEDLIYEYTRFIT